MLDPSQENICDKTIFTELYNKYAKDLHDYLYYKFGETEIINDKVQEAFIKMWDKCKDISIDKARAFLFTVGKNMMLNEFKHQEIVLQYKSHKPKDYTHENPEFLIEEQQFNQRLQKALSNLKENHRAAFLLNRIEGKTHQEVAEILGITKRAAETRIYAAFKQIMKEVEGFN